MAGLVARWNVEGPIKRYCQMRKITAYAVAALEHIPSGEIGPTREISVLNVVMHPLADGRYTRQAVRHLTEFIPREVCSIYLSRNTGRAACDAED